MTMGLGDNFAKLDSLGHFDILAIAAADCNGVSDLYHFLKSSTTSGLTDPLVTLMLMVFGHFGIDGYYKLAKLFHHIRTAGPLGYEIEACFCQDSLCNSATHMSATSMLLSFLLCIFLIRVIS